MCERSAASDLEPELFIDKVRREMLCSSSAFDSRLDWLLRAVARLDGDVRAEAAPARRTSAVLDGLMQRLSATATQRCGLACLAGRCVAADFVAVCEACLTLTRRVFADDMHENGGIILTHASRIVDANREADVEGEPSSGAPDYMFRELAEAMRRRNGRQRSKLRALPAQPRAQPRAQRGERFDVIGRDRTPGASRGGSGACSARRSAPNPRTSGSASSD